MRKTYNIFPSKEHEITMLKIVQELKFKGLMWPNNDNPQFDLELTEEELLVLKLRVPFTHFLA